MISNHKTSENVASKLPRQRTVDSSKKGKPNMVGNGYFAQYVGTSHVDY